MGFLDKLKNTITAMTPPPPPPHPTRTAQPAHHASQHTAPQPEPELESAEPPSGPCFPWDGEEYPIPDGWNDLSIDDWFFKWETLRDRMRYIDNEQLPTMEDDSLDKEEILLITQYGFTSGGHYEKYRRWAVDNWAREMGVNPTDCEFKMGAIARDRIQAKKAGAMSGAGGALSDVEGISCTKWAQLQAQIAGGGDHTALIAAAGIDAATWGRVSAEWNRRMSSDTTATVATAYANAFASSAVGPYGAQAAQAASAGVAGNVGPEPVPFETFVEISEALRAGGEPTAVLAQFGIRPVDWSNMGMYWNRRIAQEATKYHELYTQLSARFAAKYGNGDGLTIEEREEMILGKILQMAGTGQAGQILPFLRSYFPDDANDLTALDWWLDKACDMCGRSGDRASAQQLLIARYPLQENEEDPMDVWVNNALDQLF